MSRFATLLFSLCALASFLCTCDRAPETLFVARTDTGVTSANQLRETEDLNIIEYLYYYNGGGVAATDVNGDGRPDLYFTNNQGENKYYVNEGGFRFRDATAGAGVGGRGDWSTGVAVVDVDGNGLADIYVCNVSGYKGLRGRNELFLQAPDGSFTEAAADYGLDLPGFCTQSYWFDYDGDGDLDCYVARHSVHNDATYGTAAGRLRPDSLAGDRLLRNDRRPDDGTPFGVIPGRQVFTDVTEAAGLYTSKIAYALSAAVADFNGDGRPDLYVGNDFSENDYYYLNNGDGTFTEAVDSLTGHTSNFTMGSDVADFDADGRPDLLTLDMRPGREDILKSTMSADAWNVYNLKRELGYHHQLPHNALQWNRGGGLFSEVAELAGLAATDWSWSCLAEDFDLDGRTDVFVANGIERRPNDLDYLKFISSDLARRAGNLEIVANMPDGRVANQAFRQTGAWTFADVSAAWGLDLTGSSTGAAAADLDGDGDLDLVLNNVNAPATVYENTARSPDPTRPTAPARRNPAPLAAQRGMMSQSGPATVRPPAARPQPTPFYTVRPTGVVHGGATAKLFDVDPLAPYAPGPVNYPLIYLKTGELAIATDDGNQRYRVFRWDGERLVGGELRPVFAVHRQQVRGPARMPLKSLLPATGETLYARPFATLSQQAAGAPFDAVPDQTGMWQSLSLLRGEGEIGTELVAGNWGLNSALGAPTPADPLRLYTEDVDGNGTTETLLSYVRQGREVPVMDKDELAGRLPGLKRNQLSYRDYATKSFGQLFPGLTGEPQAVTTLHHLLLTLTSGGWRADTLPRAAQITTLNAALATEAGVWLGGNKTEVQPRIGRQDAAALQLLRPDGTVEMIDLGGANNRREVRQLVRLDERNLLVVVAGGEHLVVTVAAGTTL